ncbi:MAG TPA: hypothetical protein VL614_08965 [Acetobacteraceae bacterium]|jgi:hypothetical protein|nr:hypothetical protein [Acetobacteraceae bacterium]
MAFNTSQPNGESPAWPAPHDWMLVDAADPIYVDRVVGDLTDITGTQSGKALLRRIFLSRHAVSIVHAAATDPPNAWVRPGSARATGGTQTGSDALIAYDPADWPSQAYPGSPPSDAVLFALLTDACRLAEGDELAMGEAASVSLLFDSAEVARYRTERGHE